MKDLCMIQPCFFQCLVQRILYIRRGHSSAKFPGDDVPAIVIQDRTEIEPAPADYFEIGEVGLPKLVGCRRFIPELVCSFHDDEVRAGDQIMRAQKPVNTGF